MTGQQNKPFAIDVKEGETKAFCVCGLSKNAPFCDGSHKTTDLTPKGVTFDEDKTVYICGCQRSGKRPYCDGTHKTIKDGEGAKPTPRVSVQASEPIEPYIELIQELAKMV